MSVERPPAAAYPEVAVILGDAYLRVQPPREGVRVCVAGTDGIATYWDVDADTAQRLAAAVAQRDDLTWLPSERYCRHEEPS